MVSSPRHLTYSNVVIFETVAENTQHQILVLLLLDDTGGGGEDSESRLAKASVKGGSSLVEGGAQILPIFVVGLNNVG